jgi:uncharacterized protein
VVVGDVTTHTLTSADGVRLDARWWPASDDGRPDGPPADVPGDGSHPAGRVAVVVVHGFCGSQHEPSVQLLARHQAAAGRGVLTFDLRGHGRSDGATTLGLLERLDVDAAVQAARAEAEVVVVVGASMGGVASLEHLAAASAPGDGATDGDGAAAADGGVVVSTPARWQVPRTARGVMALMLTRTPPGRAMTARRMGTRVAIRPERGPEPRVRIAAVRQPVAVIHGLADRFVSPVAGRLLYAAADEPRRLDLVPGMGHGFSDAAVAPVDTAVAWVLANVDDREDAALGDDSRPQSTASGEGR